MDLGQQDALVYLLEAGFDVNATNNEGLTSVHLAASFPPKQSTTILERYVRFY